MQAGAVTGQPLTSSKPFLPQVLSVIAGHLQNARDFAFDRVPAGSPSSGGDVTVYIFCLCQRHKPTELAHSFFFFFWIPFLCLFSVFMVLSTVFLSINSPDNSPYSHSVLPVLSLPYWSFQLYILSESLPLP